MTRDVNTSERVYGALKSAVLTGAIADDGRLDFAELAGLFDVSTTPVREAAMRLLGEGVLELHPKGGVRRVRLSEFRLRALLNAHAAITLGALTDRGTSDPNEAGWASATNDEQRARVIFHSLVGRSDNPELGDIIDRLSDRLVPYRLREDRILADAGAELEALWQATGKTATLRRLVRAYHRRRIAKVAQLVWTSLASEPLDQHSS